LVTSLPTVKICRDLLAIAQAGFPDDLVTGDKRDPLNLGADEGIKTITVRDFPASTR